MPDALERGVFFERKIVARADLAAAVEGLARPLVATNGVFDILHRGHATYLARARSLGAALLVAVNSDASVRLLNKGSDRPINSQDDRAALLASLACVDLVTIFDEPVPLPVLEIARPEVYVKGGDYAINDLPEASLVRTWGGTVVAIPFEYDRSTSKLLARVRAMQS